MKNMFKVVLLSLIFLNGFVSGVAAQQHHFIYIQSDNKQPFYVSLNNKNYSSSSVGYLILPKLTDGQYTFTLGFPKDIYPQQTFNCTVNQKDIGYQLKNFGDKGWGLFNMQTLEVVMARQEEKSNIQDTSKPVANNPNAFGSMLSDVVDDSTLTQTNSVAPVTAAKTDVQQTNIAAANIEKDSSDSENMPDTVTATANTKGIIKSSEETTDKGTNLVFIDFNNTSSDTVNVFIPAENNIAATNADSAKMQTTLNNNLSQPTSSTEANAKPATVADSANNHPATTEIKNVNNPFYTSKDSSANNMVQSNLPANNVGSSSSLVKNNCSRMATEIDLDKIKKKMVVESDANEMILDAKKILKDKCVTTDEVKNLGALFLSDEGRYNFYEAMYGYAFDYGNYSSLESQLIDSYYKKRFEAMLR